MNIRKTILIKETIEADGVGKACDPICRVAALAVVQNPFAGRFVEELSPLFDLGGQLGERLMGDAVSMLAGPPVSYGKAAIVGVAGDLEHGGAMNAEVRPDPVDFGPRPTNVSTEPDSRLSDFVATPWLAIFAKGELAFGSGLIGLYSRQPNSEGVGLLPFC